MATCLSVSSFLEPCNGALGHTMLIGAMGTIFKFYAELPLIKLGRCKVRKLLIQKLILFNKNHKYK